MMPKLDLPDVGDALPRKSKWDMGAFELFFREPLDLKKFDEESQCGLNGLWLVCTEEEAPDFKRYRGVYLPSYKRIIIDVAPTYAYLAYSGEPLEVVCKILNVKSVYKDGELVWGSRNA